MSKGKKILIRVTVTVVIVLLLCTFLSRTIYNAGIPNVTKQTIQWNTQMTISTDTSGTVLYDVTPVQSGEPLTILKVDVTEGTSVTADTVVLEVDDAAFQTEIRKMELAITELNDTLDDTSGSSARADLKEQIAIAEEELDQYKASVPWEGAVKAGFTGTITHVYAAAGTIAAAGTTLFEGIRQDALPELRFTLPAETADQYAVGSEVHLSYLKTEMMNGQLTSTACTEDVKVTKKQYEDGEFAFYTDIGAEGGSFYTGMQVDVTAISSEYTYEYVVPLSAVSEASNGSYTLYTLGTRDGLFGEETYVQAVSVKKLAENSLSMAVSGDGLYMTLTVVVSADKSLTDGETVRVES